MVTERKQVSKKYWSADDNAYVLRIDSDTRRFIWFYGTGASGSWVIQIMDNEGNQIGDAEYAANKNTLRTD